MTSAELTRVAAAVIPPVRTTGWRVSVDDLVGPERRTVYAVVPIIDGRLDGEPVFRGRQRDASRMFRLLNGEGPTPREGRVPAGASVVSEDAAPDPVLREAPADPDVAQPAECRDHVAEATGSNPVVGVQAGASLLDTHLGRPGAAPSGVPATSSADARAGSSSDGGSSETERVKPSGSPAGNHMTVATQPAGAAPLGSGHQQLAAFGLPSG